MAERLAYALSVCVWRKGEAGDRMTAEAQALKGHLDVLLLAALEDGARHGYAVKEALRTGSGGRFDLPTGTIYPALHRLERAGLISGSWSVVDGRRRRSYQLTYAGRRKLTGERGNWRAFAAAITALLDHTPLPAPREDTALDRRLDKGLENGPWPATT